MATLQLVTDPLFDSISNTVKSFIEKDHQPVDLDDYLKNSSYSSQQRNAFTKSRIVPYPESLSIKIRENPYRIGLLKAIHRVWLSSNNVLYLWDYRTNDSFKYECNDIIQHVDIIDFNHHFELLISTDNFLLSHTIKCQGEKLQILSNTMIKTAGVVMSDMVATKDTKRVFMKGSNGHLYELMITLEQGLSVDSRLTCHTENPLMCYLPSFFRSTPVSKVKSVAIGSNDILYVLQDDSTIHAVNIKGTLYAPMQRFSGSNLASIHTVPTTESNMLHLMAVSEKGDRLYLRYQYPDFALVHTRPAPHLPGSYLFNGLSQEQAKVSFYQQGVFGAVLSKAEKQFLIWVCADATEQQELIENIYVESLTHSIWDVYQSDTNQLASPYRRTSILDQPRTQYMALTEAGLIRYTQNRPVDYLQQVLQSSENKMMQLFEFSQCYGYLETNCMAYMLACDPNRKADEAIAYLSQSVRREEGLLLYFSRIVQDVWTVDVATSNVIPLEKWKDIQDHLKQLLVTIQSSPISLQNEIISLIVRTVESISLICFVYQLEWDQIKQALKSKSIDMSITFADLVSTEMGAQLCQEIVLTAIHQSKLANATNQFSFIGSFLDSDCQTLFGKSNITYYKGLECLESARNHPDQATDAIEKALEHLQTIIEMLDIATLNDLSRSMYALDHHLAAIRLIFTKYQTVDASAHDALYSILLPVIDKAVQQPSQKSRSILMNTLRLTLDEEFHHQIYHWLYDHKQKQLLITLETPLLLNYIQTHILNLPERYACLKKYYTHRQQHELAIDSLVTLATEVDGVALPNRVKLLQSACNELPLIASNEDTKQKAGHIQHAYKTAQIQLDIHATLAGLPTSSEVEQSLNRVASSLLPADELLAIAYQHSLYEPALYLLHLLDQYDWEFVKRAWSSIVNSYQDEVSLKSKVIELADRLYPSTSSFPVYIILQNLQNHLNADFAYETLVKAGVPSEVVSDAKETISSY